MRTSRLWQISLKYKWDLVYTCEKAMLDATTFETVSTLQLRQKAKKKLFDGWVDYETKYYVLGDSWVDVSFNGFSYQGSLDGKEQVVERKGEVIFTIVSVKALVPQSSGIANHAYMSVELNIAHRPNYVSWDEAGAYRVQDKANLGREQGIVFRNKLMAY